MSRPIIVVGDKTDHGGTVISGSPFTKIDGKDVARVGDKVTCPKHGPSPIITTIATGDPANIVDGQPVARHGDKTACGATLISSQATTVVDASAGDKGSSLDEVAAGLATAVAVSTAVITAKAIRQANSDTSQSATSGHDEQVRFVNSLGAPLAAVNYRLEMEDGSVLEGLTDGEGRTARIETEGARKIIRAELSAQEAPCCPQSLAAGSATRSVMEVPMDGVSTNDVSVGSSVVTVATPEGETRGLTPDEVAMSRQVFGDAIDYARVKVHNGEYLWFGLQPDNTAMTPNGEIYFNPSYFREDFSDPVDPGPGGQVWFMHEMTHVWQHQLGYPVKWKRGNPVGWLMSYKYNADRNKRLSDYNMEEQGDIIADYYALKILRNPYAVSQERYQHSAHLSLLETMLQNFLRSPGDVANLPGGGKARRDARREERASKRAGGEQPGGDGW